MRYVAAIIMLIFVTTALYADTVIMKDRTRVKGLVVEEYVDRITLSTVDGEKSIFRKDIERVEYDTPEQNFMQLGRAYDAKGWYDKAAFYYKKAMEVNPAYKEAREAYLASHAKMWRQEEKMARKELERRSMAMEWWKHRDKAISSPDKDKAALLKDILGISLMERDGIFTIEEVRPYSSAAKAGIQEGDTLVSIWGKHIRYSNSEEVIDGLLGPKYSEVRVSIEKDISIPINDINGNLYKSMGIFLDFEYEGLVVKDVVSGKIGEIAGLRKGDFVIAIDKNIMRYLPLNSVVALINSAKSNQDIVFTIRRTINLRREGKR